MQALINNNKVVTIYKTPKALTIGDIQYPSSIFTRWSTEELAVLGIKHYREVVPNQRYYSFTDYTDEVNDTEAVRTYTPVARSVEGLKTLMLEQVNQLVSGKQGEIDWYWSRASKGGKAVPEAIEAYAQAIYADQVTKEAEVNALVTLEDIMAYEATPHTLVTKVKHTDDDGVETYGPELNEPMTQEINMVTGGWTENPNNEVDPSFVSLTKV